MHCALPGDYHGINLICIQFRPPMVTSPTSLTVVTVPGLYYCKSNAWGWPKR